MEQTGAAARLNAEVMAAVARQLYAAWRECNWNYFKETLSPAVISLVSGEARLGRWVPETRTIEIAERLVREQPWGVVVEVLKHEMAHQYVHEVLGHRDETAHGPTFRSVCERMGIDASAAGMPTATERTEGEQRILQKIARLLALAESTNLHEAESAMGAAQRLMLKYNLELGAHRLGYAFRHLGQPRVRMSEPERRVAMILNQFFFVEAIWVHSYVAAEQRMGRVLEVCGTPANLDMAEYVHSFLLQTAERLWTEHRRERGIRGNRDRRTFMAGVMIGFAEKLAVQKQSLQREGLVWRGDADLSGFFRRRHPHVRTTRIGGAERTEAHDEGRAAGRRIVIHRPVETGTGGGGRLLPGRQPG